MYLFIYFIAFLALAHGHAVLQSPTPYNTNPTKTGPCGVNTVTDAMKNQAFATWTAGAQATVTWNLVISDGAGDVTGYIDMTGSGTAAAWTTAQKVFEPFPTYGNQIKMYQNTFTVPDNITCKGSPSGYCILQMKSATGWFSCTTIDVLPKTCTPGDKSAQCDGAPAPPATCTRTNGQLTFCPDYSAIFMQGGVMTDKNNELRSTWDFNLNNTLVFSNGKNAACQADYQKLICALAQPCNMTTGQVIPSLQACRSQCKQTMKECQVVDLHAPLYPCDNYPLCPGETEAADNEGGSGGSKGGMSAGGKAFLVLFFIGIFAAAGFAFYTYNKQGHLMGYVWDKHSGKFVKKEANPHNYTAYVDQ